MKNAMSLTVIASLLAAGALLAADAKPKAPKVTNELIAKGKAAYDVNCITCHGAEGDGQGDAGKYLNPPPRHFGKDAFKQGGSVEAIFQTLGSGVPGTAMIPFAHLPEEDRWGLAYYVIHFQPTKDGKKVKKIVDAVLKAPPTPPAPVPPPATPDAPAIPTPVPEAVVPAPTAG